MNLNDALKLASNLKEGLTLSQRDFEAIRILCHAINKFKNGDEL